MNTISKKTLQDLEYQSVLEQVAAYTLTDLAKQKALTTQPIQDKQDLLHALARVHEYVSSFTNNNIIPNHRFDAITSELHLLQIEGSTLEVKGFYRIVSIAQTTAELLTFFKKFNTYYPSLYRHGADLVIVPEIKTAIDKVIDKFGEVKDNASAALLHIRKEMSLVRGKINASFSHALNTYQKAEYLDDIRESVVENRRVLAVKAMYRRKVKGAIMGTSKTGSIVYIEPEATLQHSRALASFLYEQKKEVERILRALTDYIRPFYGLLAKYQEFLTDIDLVSAKALHARDINAILPEITQDRSLHLKDAYHPLLLRTNMQQGKKTYPQTITLHKENRIIVISGPNAGGKSITLKTIGLLQLMLQSGMLIPVHERSTICLFDRILTDIGDNQSIENHLSTYSYRLKNMNYFLKKCNDKTLFLIDEFGTGSDPELGGALAETFLEVFYEREAYGIITTHYANLKILANELPYACNANMMFDNKTLEPIFKLVIGQAGSSFTFEVAQKNGIPYSLINKAKKKIERGKVRFDATIAKLQKERTQLEKTTTKLKTNQEKAREESDRLEKLNTRVQHKLESYQELFDANQRLIALGKRINALAQTYFETKKKKNLIADFLRIVETENAKRKRQTKKEKQAIAKKQEVVLKEVSKKIEVIREQKKEIKKQKQSIQDNTPKVPLKIGDRVRLIDGKAVGSIDAIERKKAIVNYGMFTTNVALDQLELVQAVKKK